MRGSSLDAGRRAYLTLTRGTVSASDDTPKMQTLDVRTMQNELLTGAERFQTYGFSSVPRDPDGSEGNAKAAEVVVGFINGNRSHPIVLSVDDRRSRPTNWQKGDSGLWHYRGATAKFTDNGWVKDAGTDKKPDTTTVGNCVVTWADGKATINVNGTKVVVMPGKICLGDESASIPVMLQTGPSTLVFATH